ncbi:cupin domain-containing protein [Patescibacteria group bacterium]|nr:cupin domain-containing protein [Patescibacteria group bacterium]
MKKTSYKFDFSQAPLCQDVWADEDNRIVHTPSITLMTFQMSEGWSFADAGHSNEQMTLILKGELEMTVGTESYRLKSGQGVYVPPNTPHSGRILSKVAEGLDIFTPIRTEDRYKKAITVA